MSVEVRPMGVACPLQCDYCYQEPERKAGNIKTKYDLDKIIAEIDRVGQRFHLFGGEALLIPKKDLEYLWKYGYEKFKDGEGSANGVQTSGILIDDDHIEMFKKYDVNVGISIDGPNELNSLRKVRGRTSNNEATQEATQKTMDNIVKLLQAGVKVGIIITMHRQNGSPDRIPRLLNFIRWLGDIGITQGTIHTLELEATMPDQDLNAMTQDENIEAFLTIANFLEKNPDLQWSPFSEMKSILNADDDRVTCYWNACDPLDTQAVYGIEGDGALSNCGRTNKEGIDWYKADGGHQYSRYIGFYNTPDEMGGCQGCRFWMACGGSCPGEAQNGDFRNKTTNCKTMKTMLTYFEDQLERKGIEPITKSDKRKQIEDYMLHNFYNGRQVTISQAIKEIEGSVSATIQIPVEGSNV